MLCIYLPMYIQILFITTVPSMLCECIHIIIYYTVTSNHGLVVYRLIFYMCPALKSTQWRLKHGSLLIYQTNTLSGLHTYAILYMLFSTHTHTHTHTHAHTHTHTHTHNTTHTHAHTHTHSSQLGGEIQAVEMAMKALSSHHSIIPDSIVTQLTPVFGQRK